MQMFFHEPGKGVIDEEYLAELRASCSEPVLSLEDGAYQIFKLPNPESFYVIGVDVGEGIGRSNSVAQILDVSNLQDIQQVALFSSNNINPFHFGTRLMGILQDWGRPPILVENNNNGQQILDVLCQTHNYENVVSYHFEGFSKHYNNANRFGIHNHTNTRYKGITNFRYWVNSLKAVKLNDIETLLEIDNFIRLPNFTYSKKSDKYLDDRVFGLIWALFILDPSLVGKYFNILDIDDQGRPMKIFPISDNKEIIKNSPLLIGGGQTIIRKPSINTPFSHVGDMDMASGFDLYSDDRAALAQWLLESDGPDRMLPLKADEMDKSSMDTYHPTIVF
jgi:hypothetical protein